MHRHALTALSAQWSVSTRIPPTSTAARVSSDGLACLIIGETVLGRRGGKRRHRHLHRFDYLPFYLRHRPIQNYAGTGTETGHRCDRRLGNRISDNPEMGDIRHVKMQLHAGREDTEHVKYSVDIKNL